jgi:hypothetical protein
VTEARRRARLGEELARERPARRRRLGEAHELERDAPPEDRVAREVHRPHRAAAEQAHDAEVVDERARRDPGVVARAVGLARDGPLLHRTRFYRVWLNRFRESRRCFR